MDYEKFKQDMEQDVLKNLANRGIEAETDVRHIDKLNDGYDALTVKAPGSVIGVNINLSSAFAAYEDVRDYIDIVERASDQAAKGITESKSFDIDRRFPWKWFQQREMLTCLRRYRTRTSKTWRWYIALFWMLQMRAEPAFW